MGKICAFFGHRTAPHYLLANKYIERAIISLIKNEGVDTFWFGGNGNFDSYANSAARKVQQQLYPEIKRILIVPYQTQLHPKYYQKDSNGKPVIENFGYDGVEFPEELLFAPKRFAITYRNRYEVENADCFICYIVSNYGGAYNAFKLAKHKNKKVINLADDEEVKQAEIEHRKEMAKLKKLYGDNTL